ncbi:MAG: iron-sulfur cluster repair di-iron protein [Polyangiales bacterium]
MSTAPVSVNADDRLGDVALRSPSAARVLEKLGFDYCCGGKKSLAAACADRGLDVPVVLEALSAVEETAPPVDPGAMELDRLIYHVLDTHHVYTREAFERLLPLAHKVRNRHGSTHAVVLRIADLVEDLHADLMPHLMKEEQVLFPYALARIAGRETRMPLGASAGPIACMQHEHTAAGEILFAIREATNNFVPPAEACASWRALYQGLDELVHDVMQHIAVENEVLFPRILAMDSVGRPA